MQAVSSEDVEYTIYSVLIEEMYVKEKVRTIVIKDHTALSPVTTNLSNELKRVKNKIPTISPQTLDNFQEKNEISVPIKKGFKLNRPYMLFTERENEEIFKDPHGWNQFYSRYSDSQGLMTLSRVGLNSEMDQALVYVGNQQGGVGGAGFYVFLSLKNGRWSIIDSYGVWIS